MANGPSNDSKLYHDEIADTRDNTQVLKGILPKNMKSYQAYKVCKNFFYASLVLGVFLIVAMFVPQLTPITSHQLYMYVVLGMFGFGLLMMLFSMLIRAIRLRKPPFDDWVFEIAEKYLGTTVIFYNSTSLFIEYKRTGQEKDKREFVREMSDKSEHYTYFYVKTFIDTGFVQVECTKRQPIPHMSRLNVADDTLWNVIPLGLTLNSQTQKVSPTGWYLNHNNQHDYYVDTGDSVVLLITGGTGCYSRDTLIRMHNSLIR